MTHILDSSPPLPPSSTHCRSVVQQQKQRLYDEYETTFNEKITQTAVGRGGVAGSLLI